LKVLEDADEKQRVRAGYVLHVANQSDSFQLVTKGVMLQVKVLM
jgi:hypothetical protein